MSMISSIAVMQKGELMTNGEAVNWLINISADIGKAEHRDLWHYEQALYEIRETLESAQPEIIRCRQCKQFRRWIDTDFHFCDRTEVEVSLDDFCSRAERREEL